MRKNENYFDVQEDGRMTEELREAVGTSRAASRHISTTLTLGLGRNYVTPLYLYSTVYSLFASRPIHSSEAEFLVPDWGIDSVPAAKNIWLKNT